MMILVSFGFLIFPATAGKAAATICLYLLYVIRNHPTHYILR